MIYKYYLHTVALLFTPMNKPQQSTQIYQRDSLFVLEHLGFFFVRSVIYSWALGLGESFAYPLRPSYSLDRELKNLAVVRK